jgi:dinuclear metal center YbgI/SA1388 family protein
MATAVKDWLALLEGFYPQAWAEPWDRVGLQVGDASWSAERLLVALDPTSHVITEARNLGCGLLVTHHPLIFKPLERLTLDDPVARTALEAAEGRVAVAAYHTNADVAMPGVSDALADALGVEVTGVLHPTEAGSRVKLVTFVPAEATAKVLDALAGAGAGVIGEYSHCSFRVRGTGTFLPAESAHPALGERGALNEVEEDRLEIVVPRERVTASVQALVDAHPYEEVAYDIYPLGGPSGLGLGRVGRIPEPVAGGELADRCREALGAAVRLAGPSDREVRTVALCGGSGADLAEDALRAGADAYVTGDVKHHQALEAVSAGLIVIDAGHHGTEWPFVPHLAARLRAEELGEVLVSETRTDPFEERR